MAINAVASNGAQALVAAAQANSAPVRAERAKDGDRDDRAAQVQQQTPPQPTVNTNGQVVGSLINVTA